MIIVKTSLGNYTAKNWHKAECQAVKLSQSVGDVIVESAGFKGVYVKGKRVSLKAKSRKEAFLWQSNRSHSQTNRKKI